MTATRRGLGHVALLAVTAALTTWLATVSWRGFVVHPGSYLVPLLALAAVVAGVGVLARWWRLSAPVVVALQILTSTMAACVVLVGTPLPLGPAWPRLLSAFGDAMDSANAYAPPVPVEAPSVDPLLVVGGLGCLLLVDLLVCTFHRVPLAGLPLLAVYSVPVGLLSGGLTWWVFGGVALGFLLLLYLDEGARVARWGRALAGPVPETGLGDLPERSASVGLRAGAIGGLATATALVVPLAIPTLDVHLLDLGRGGSDGSSINLENPMVDLRRDLDRPTDRPVLTVVTDDPDPSYLRIAVLNRFTDNEWTSGDREVPVDQTAAGQMPPLVGVDPTVRQRDYRWEISVEDDFASTWLPTPTLTSRVLAPGDWRYDQTTRDFLAGDDDLTTAGLDYSLTGIDLDLEAADLALAPGSAGLVPADLTDLPDDLPAVVRDTALEVTAQAPGRFDKMVALQDWFRRDGGFTYSLDRVEGTGTDELVEFISEDGRTGYCEQFAAAMAVMARSLGVPARVAVGFLRPDRGEAPDEWVYSSHDLHAWPEVFITGAGWVRFEPTPPARARTAPPYTLRDPSVPEETEGPQTPRGGEQEETPDRGGDAATPTAAPTPGASPDEAAGADSADDPGWLVPVAVSALVLALLGLVLLAPRLVRARRRERRLSGGAEEVWAELADTAADLGLPWPTDRSPREVRDRVAPQLGTSGPAAAAALDRVVDALERDRYAHPSASPAPAASLREDAETCRAAMAAAVGGRAAGWARWWPRSVFGVRAATGGSVTAESHDRVVDRVG